MKAVRIPVTGPVEVIDLPEPAEDDAPVLLAELYSAIGCDSVECVRLADVLDAWLDDSRGGERQPLNHLASHLAEACGIDEPLHGVVVVLAVDAPHPIAAVGRPRATERAQSPRGDHATRRRPVAARFPGTVRDRGRRSSARLVAGLRLLVRCGSSGGEPAGSAVPAAPGLDGVRISGWLAVGMSSSRRAPMTVEPCRVSRRRPSVGRARISVCPAAHAGGRCRFAGCARRGRPGGEVLRGDSPDIAVRNAEVFARLMAELAGVTVAPPLPNPPWVRWDHADPGAWPAIAHPREPGPEGSARVRRCDGGAGSGTATGRRPAVRAGPRRLRGTEPALEGVERCGRCTTGTAWRGSRRQRWWERRVGRSPVPASPTLASIESSEAFLVAYRTIGRRSSRPWTRRSRRRPACGWLPVQRRKHCAA